MFKLLHTFRVAYDMRNFSQTAEALFMSQPAVSNQMKQLENQLQCVLFKRVGKQEMRPTKAADILYERLLDLSDDWHATLRLIQGQEMETIVCRMSASHTFASYYLPELLPKLVDAFPTVKFELEMGNSEDVLTSVKRHEVHFGFIEKPLQTTGIERIPLTEDELVLAGDLESELWLIREKTSGVYHYTARYFVEHNLNPNYLLVENNDMIVRLLEQGLGKSLISKKAVNDEIDFERLNQNYQRWFYLIKGNHLSEEIYDEIANQIAAFYK
ncbi:LysR family transcriptional regulator [Vagococcus penaei]|uniref:LysR family transcriptional regulator n=1 Tax=Vagococcus penaei TaxID=633807 RepID=A0A1Q2D7P5_9ENTE|nr:LysR family transcriptional regulator [Vagococcus penaei]AQP54446.1 LysR family transcriptional regulator [Vagococcus penaei]RSU06363.1 LysR family transcriptional regulator [Vagococcus penaei]